MSEGDECPRCGQDIPEEDPGVVLPEYEFADVSMTEEEALQQEWETEQQLEELERLGD